MTEDEGAFVEARVEEASALALGLFGSVRPSVKDDHSWVTEADRRVQDLLVESLERRFPRYGFLGEEQSLHRPPEDGEPWWVIDPIDGTSAFVTGLPVWTISVGLVSDGVAEAGFIAEPVTGDRFAVVGPGGHFRANERRATLRDPADPGRESLFLTPSRMHQEHRIDPRYPGKVRCLGSTASYVAYVAAGRADAALLGRVSLWDVAAGLAMLRAVGGRAMWLESGEAVEVEAMLDGARSSDSMLVGHPDTLEVYRGLILRA